MTENRPLTQSQQEVIPSESLTGFMRLPGLGRIRLDFLVTFESGEFYIRCLDLGVMSCGQTLEECKENIREAILIYLEDLPEGQSLFKPASQKHWRMFCQLRASAQQRETIKLTPRARSALGRAVRHHEKVALTYA